MGQPGNPSDPGDPPEGAAPSEPDPEQPDWASPTPPPEPSAPPAYPQPPTSEPPAYEQPPTSQQPPSDPTPYDPSTPPPYQPPPQPPYQQPPVQPLAPPYQQAPAWGAEPPAWGAPPPGGTPPPMAPGGGWVPPGQTPGPAPRKRRLTWLWFLIPVLLVFVASVVVIVIFAVKLITGPIEATNDYYADLKAGNYVAAYDHLCAPLQRNYTQSQFVQLQRGDTQSKGQVQDYNFTSSELHSNDDANNGDALFDATAKGTVTRGGSRYQARVALRKEDGDWKVCAVSER